MYQKQNHFFSQNPTTKNIILLSLSMILVLVCGRELLVPFTYQSCWNQSEQVPFFRQVHSVRQEYENTLSHNFGNDEKEHAKFSTESIAPGTDVKCKEDGEK
jgi:hypothetical protein